MNTQTEQTAVAQTPAARAPRPTVSPRYGISETAEAYIVKAAVPGVAPADVETIVDGEKLVVNARRTWSAPEGWTAVHRESVEADYRLVLALDRRVARDGVKAQLTQGVLTLTLPKADEIKPRKIEING
jgi:HSP20 family protein